MVLADYFPAESPARLTERRIFPRDSQNLRLSRENSRVNLKSSNSIQFKSISRAYLDENLGSGYDENYLFGRL